MRIKEEIRPVQRTDYKTQKPERYRVHPGSAASERDIIYYTSPTRRPLEITSEIVLATRRGLKHQVLSPIFYREKKKKFNGKTER